MLVQENASSMISAIVLYFMLHITNFELKDLMNQCIFTLFSSGEFQCTVASIFL